MCSEELQKIMLQILSVKVLVRAELLYLVILTTAAAATAATYPCHALQDT